MRRWILLVVPGLLLGAGAWAQTGVAPTGDPGGFSVDGDLTAYADTTDWVATLLTPSGLPNSSATGYAHDETPELSMTGGGTKWSLPLWQWRWTTIGVTGAMDLGNVVTHFSRDAAGHLWFMWGATRRIGTGDWWMGVELLQNDLVRNGDGTFGGAGPHGGKTAGDVLLISNSAGFSSELIPYVWTSLGDTSGYYEVRPRPSGSLLAHNPVAIGAPYPAFGDSARPAGSFVEGAIDLAAISAAPAFQTVWFVTQSSNALTATLRDFAGPIRHLSVTAVPWEWPRGEDALVRPNPARDVVTITFEVEREGPTLLEIFDLSGRRVGSVEAGPLSIGRHSLRWDPAVSGLRGRSTVLFLRVSGSGRSRTQRFALVR